MAQRITKDLLVCPLGKGPRVFQCFADVCRRRCVSPWPIGGVPRGLWSPLPGSCSCFVPPPPPDRPAPLIIVAHGFAMTRSRGGERVDQRKPRKKSEVPQDRRLVCRFSSTITINHLVTDPDTGFKSYGTVRYGTLRCGAVHNAMQERCAA